MIPTNRFFYFAACILLLLIHGSALSQPVQLRCDYRQQPSGVTSQQPRFSWEVTTAQRGALQTAWQIMVSDDAAALARNNATVWNSGKVSSTASAQVAYNGPPLMPAKKYYWKVRYWDRRGKRSRWSETASWQMGLPEARHWQGAQWIAYEEMPAAEVRVPAVHGAGNAAWGPGKNTLPLLRKTFNVQDKPLQQATIFISGLGHFDLFLNGQKTGDHFLDPGWVQYRQQAQYLSFNLTDQLHPGANALGVMLGNGFYHIPRERYRKLTGSFGYPKMICRLLLVYADGTEENVTSGTDWQTAAGPITYSSIYGGESYDANLEQPGWATPAFDARGWKQAIAVKGPPMLTSQTMEPLRIMDTLNVQSTRQPKPGVWVYDLGQNASGIPRITVQGNKGTLIRITPGELLDDSGLVTQQASGGPSFYTYTLKGGAPETWQPQFTYYGFRYLQVEGGTPGKELITVQGLHTRHAAPEAGYFSCSDTLFNKIYQLIHWSIRSNLASVLTDCPHREKLGWLEVLHLMGNSMRYNYELAPFFKKILGDMRGAQLPNGLVPDIAPEYTIFHAGFRDSPEWGSASVIVPWDVYRWYGDEEVLKENYHMMQRYVDYLGSKSLLDTLRYGLGDWFDIGPNGVGPSQLTPIELTAYATYYHNLNIMTATAALLQKPQDAQYYAGLRDNVKQDFNKKFFRADSSQYATGSQTANAMALYMGLVPEEHRAAVLQNILADIAKRNNSLSTGEVGFSYLLRVLQDAGQSDLISKMNNRSDVPGYGYQLARGATALTESWQAYRFVSNNHMMLGHLMEWFYAGLAGISQAEGSVAFRRITIRPQPAGGLTAVKAGYHTPYGMVRSEWNKTENTFGLSVEIPANTTAIVHLPLTGAGIVTESGKPAERVKGLRLIRKEGPAAIYEAGSGQYHFSVR